MNAAFGDDRAGAPADSNADWAAPAAHFVFVAPASNELESTSRTRSASRSVIARVKSSATRLLPLAWALLLGLVSVESSIVTKYLGRYLSDPTSAPCAGVEGFLHEPSRVARLEPCSHRRTHKRIIPRLDPVRGNDPTDDGTSRDPDDDDDTTNDLSVDNTSNEPFVAWLLEMDRYLILLGVHSAPIAANLPSSPFPTFERLRC
jgi:hypothetical protein